MEKELILIPSNISKKRLEHITKCTNEDTPFFVGYSKDVELYSISLEDFNLIKENICPFMPQGYGLEWDMKQWNEYMLTNEIYIDLLRISNSKLN